eukprot:8070998-Pyramimonas_sp.AAC.1
MWGVSCLCSVGSEVVLGRVEGAEAPRAPPPGDGPSPRTATGARAVRVASSRSRPRRGRSRRGGLAAESRDPA